MFYVTDGFTKYKVVAVEFGQNGHIPKFLCVNPITNTFEVIYAENVKYYSYDKEKRK